MADISKIKLPNNSEYNIKDANAVKKTGDTMTGNLVVPSERIANTYYGISFGRTTGTPVETILYTGIKWVSSTHMPVVHITGYAYGLQSPVEFKIGFYIYGGSIGYCGVTNMGSWAPEVYLFKYVKDEVEYVAIGLSGSCYFLQLQADVQDEMGKFRGIVVDSNAWSWSFLTTAGTIPTPDSGVTCIKVAYKANILKPANATKADSAAKATADASGNTITSYYAPKSTAVTNVALATNKITKTINGSTTDVVTAATTSAYGITKLNSATNSTSTTEAATPSAVKTAYDLANGANTTANTALSGVNGTLIYDHTYTISNGVATFTPHVYLKGTEVTTSYATSCFGWKYRLIDGSEVTLTTKSDRGCDVTINQHGYGGHVIGTFTPT